MEQRDIMVCLEEINMSHIDTLKVYRQYVGAGYTDQQATCAVDALNSSFDGVATKDDLKSLEKDINSKFNYVYAMGAAIFMICCVPVLERIFTPAQVICQFHKESKEMNE